VYEKMHRFSFTKTTWRTNTPLELIHADICGPIRTPSISNNRYFLLFVDDYSRMIWIYLLDKKSEAFSILFFNSKLL
jgi:histone deacetylase 1/2